MRDKYEKRLEEYESELASIYTAMANRKKIKELRSFLKKPRDGMEFALCVKEKDLLVNVPGYTFPESQYEALSDVLAACQKGLEELLDNLLFEGCNG